MKKKSLGVFSLTMINLAAIMSLRNLPLMANYGLAMVFFYLVAILCFFIPTALISAELASTISEEGGAYVWIRRAIGARTAFLCEWIGFATTVTSLALTIVFLSTSLLLSLSPALSQCRFLIAGTAMAVLWGATLLSLRGIALTSHIVSIASILGTVLPALLLILLGLRWLLIGGPIQLSLSPSALLPDFSRFSNVSFLAGLMFAFAGIEMSSYYVRDVPNPKRTYPRAIFFSATLILLLSLLGSLAIAVAVTPSEMRIEAGATQALSILLNSAHLSFLTPLMGFLITFGGAAYLFAWIAGPVRGLYAVRRDGFLPPTLQRTDRLGTPVALLLLQAALVTVLMALFLCIPSTSLCFWIINAASSVLILILYACLFLAGLILHRRMADVPRPFSIPGGFPVLCLLAAVGLTNVAFCVIVSFFLPTELVGTLSRSTFGWTVAGAVALLACPPFIFMTLRQPHWKTHKP
ncbi:MAG: APC family permease [Puniceicoccales bacterium]|jgi:amino acid transporter|nr:APC family permease [Puniceicoccales bacterium]